MSDAIARVATRLIRVPLRRPWGHDVPTITLVAVDLTTDAGDVGHGFAWTPTVGGTSVRAFIDDELAPRAVGRPADPAIWDGLWAAVHEAGGGGVTSIALAGVDLALWDLRGRREGRSVIDLLGRRHDAQPVYGSGVNRHYPIEDLVAQAERFVARGYGTVKVKVGGRSLEEDVERVGAVRDAIGRGRGLMVDANQLWDLDTAVRAAGAMARFDVRWLEEPLRADDTAGYAALRRRIDVPVALGENAHTWYRFRDLLDAVACDVAQPNVVRVGGITPFLRILGLCRERGVPAHPHLLLDLSAQLAMTVPEETWVEDVEDASFEALGALASPPACGSSGAA
jgi:L-alanine-DL-glutamate epimerase-like enolase superfamily enzyme